MGGGGRARMGKQVAKMGRAGGVEARMGGWGQIGGDQ